MRSTIASARRREAYPLYLVMPALVAGIHVLFASMTKKVDGRDKPGHDGSRWIAAGFS
jgi:hypothetical protein